MRDFRTFVRLTAVSMAALVWPALVAAGGIDDFKLSRAIPADVFMVTHARTHDGRAFLDKQYEKVWKALEEAHLERDIKRLIKGSLTEEADQQQFEQRWRDVNDLLAVVTWGDLAGAEQAIAMRVEFPVPQFIMLCTPKADTFAKNFEGLGGMMKAVADAAKEEISLSSEGSGEQIVHKLALANNPFPIGVTLARHKEVLLFGFGTTLPEQALALLEGGGSGANLASTPRFKSALAGLPAADDSVAFVDMARLMTQLRAYVSGAVGMHTTAQGEPDPKLAAIPDKLITAFDLVDYIVSVSSTHGMKTSGQEVVAFKPGAADKPLYKVFMGNGSIKEPLRYVPAAAKDVMVSSGIDLAALYEFVTGFITTEIPDGAEKIAMFKAFQEQMKFDLEKDVLSWLTGGVISFSVRGRTSFSPDEWVFMLAASDEAKARALLDRMVEELTPVLSQQSGQFADAVVEGAEGFRVVIHPLLKNLPIGKPTFGVADGQLIVGSSPKIIEQALLVAAGKADSFAKNERFIAEGVLPSGPVLSVSFTDLSRWGEDFGQSLKMAGALELLTGGANSPFANPPMRAALGIVSKLGPVIQRIDFYMSASSCSTLVDGRVVTRTVMNYREPPTTTPASSPSPGAGASKK
ncbi:MAG: hypothetical protein CHACPFDD_02883 [Phycisphaerae bacterium]|nr:hypothetical protein [Phycisphaerae bacterium]